MKWEHWGGIPYREAWHKQRSYVQSILAGEAEAKLVLAEHPPTITLGSSSQPEHLLLSLSEYEAREIEVMKVDRGGDVTYHGPGQLVGYPLLIWPAKMGGARAYLRALEEVLIRALAHFSIRAVCKGSHTGVWVGDAKIAALGVKLYRIPGRPSGYVTSHGFALNVTVDLRPFTFIVPCGIQTYGVTSLGQILGTAPACSVVEKVIVDIWLQRFGFLPSRLYLGGAS